MVWLKSQRIESKAYSIPVSCVPIPYRDFPPIVSCFSLPYPKYPYPPINLAQDFRDSVAHNHEFFPANPIPSIPKVVFSSQEPAYSPKYKSAITISLPQEGSLSSQKAKNASTSAEETKRTQKVDAYTQRNVYKSIVRHICSYTRKHCISITGVLYGAGYSREDIEHAFFEISSYLENGKDTVKCKFQSTLQGMVERRSIYTYILKETLSKMINKWEEGKIGRIAKGNFGVYKGICELYYKKAVSAIGSK